MLFADDVVLVDETRLDVSRKLELWRQISEFKGFRVNTTKNEYIKCDFSSVGCKEGNVSLEGQTLPERDSFQGSVLQSNGDIGEDVSHRIKTGWMKWWQTSRFLCDKVQQKIKGKF